MNNQIVQSNNFGFLNRQFSDGDTYEFTTRINKAIQLMMTSTVDANITIRYLNHFYNQINSTNHLVVGGNLFNHIIQPISPFVRVEISFPNATTATLELIEGAIDNVTTGGTSMPQQLQEALSSGSASIVRQAIGINIPNTGLPRDIWDYSAVGNYPLLGSITSQPMEVLSSSGADTGQLSVTGYQNVLSSSPVTMTFTLNGTTPVSIGSWLHITDLRYNSANANVGAINVRLSLSPTTIVAHMRAGVGRTYSGLVFVPSGKTLYVKSITAFGRGPSSPNASGYFRSVINGLFSLNLPFSIRSVSAITTEYNYELKIPGMAAMIPSVFVNSITNSEIQIELTGIMI